MALRAAKLAMQRSRAFGSLLSTPRAAVPRLSRSFRLAAVASQRTLDTAEAASQSPGWGFYGLAGAAGFAASAGRYEMTPQHANVDEEDEDVTLHGANRDQLARLARNESGPPAGEGERDEAPDPEAEAEPPGERRQFACLLTFYFEFFCLFC